MSRTETTNHQLGQWETGDHPKDDAPLDVNWNWNTIDKLCWKAGTSFPSSYQIGSFFLRTDENKVYENTGTLETPIWTLRLDGTNTGGDADKYVRVSSGDTTSGYLDSKLVAGTNITLTKNNTGSNESYSISTSSGHFGEEYQSTSSESTSCTTSDSYQQKLRLSADSLPAGNYHIGWTCEVATPNGKYVSVRVQLDDTTTLNMSDHLDDSGADFTVYCSFREVTLTTGNHFVDLDFKSSQDNKGVSIKRARIELWRVS